MMDKVRVLYWKIVPDYLTAWHISLLNGAGTASQFVCCFISLIMF